MKKSKISSLADLQEERRRLRLMTQVTKREMSHSLGLMRSETKKVALNNIALPVGATAAAGMLLNSLLKSKSQESQPETKSTGSGITTIVTALIPFAMKFMENKRQQSKLEDSVN